MTPSVPTVTPIPKRSLKEIQEEERRLREQEAAREKERFEKERKAREAAEAAEREKEERRKVRAALSLCWRLNFFFFFSWK
jgi:hypothetical protein